MFLSLEKNPAVSAGPALLFSLWVFFKVTLSTLWSQKSKLS